MSFILDALRKSEHERQRSAVPGLSQVPLATPSPQMPRWALAVIGVLGAAVLVLGAAWIYSMRVPTEIAASPPTVERSVELPLPSRATAPQQAAPSRLPDQGESLSAAAGASTLGSSDSAQLASPGLTPPVRLTNLPDDAVASESSGALPSLAMITAEGVAVPTLHLELHAYSAQPRDRFVFINGRKYVEGDRLAEGPVLVSIAPTGAVLSHAGRRFMLVQE